MSDQQSTETVGHAPASEHAEPTFLGFDPGGWVAIAMLVVFGVFIWQRVPAAIGRALDGRIKLIRDQLAEAQDLRKEAEALKKEYEKKSKSADKDAAALIERAKHEAVEIVAKAKTDADALIERRSRMAEDKIAAEERAAIDQLRATAAEAATKAAARLIDARHDAATDGKLVDQAIKEIAGR
jgi:F-type H+-transporting ATPase subunit b